MRGVTEDAADAAILERSFDRRTAAHDVLPGGGPNRRDLGGARQGRIRGCCRGSDARGASPAAASPSADLVGNPGRTSTGGLPHEAAEPRASLSRRKPDRLQARAQGYTGTIIGGNGFNSPAVLNNAGADAEGLVVGGAWNYGNPNPTESSVAFVTAYEAKYDTSPDQFAAQAYTGAWLLATAIRCADSVDRVAVRDTLLAVADFDSPLGVFSFDENRDPVHDPIAQIVVGGKFVPLAAALEGSAEATPEATAAS